MSSAWKRTRLECVRQDSRRAWQGGGGRQGRRGSHEARVAAAGVLGDKKSTPLIKVVAGLRAVFLLIVGVSMADLQRATTEERASHLPERSHLAHQEPHIGLSAVRLRERAGCVRRARAGQGRGMGARRWQWRHREREWAGVARPEGGAARGGCSRSRGAAHRMVGVVRGRWVP